MNKPKLGALVVGQGPRPEIEAEIMALAGGSIDLDLRGALDGFSRAEIDAMRPRDDADALFTRLPDGSGVTIGKRHVVEHGTRQLETLTAAGYDVTMVMCTGEFPCWMERYRAIFPSRVLASTVKACLPAGRIGVLAPLSEQCFATEARWRAAGYEPTVLPMSPNATTAEARSAAAALGAANPALIVLDCMSYTREIKQVVREAAGKPVILAVSSAIRMALELVD